jgi:hypothetical protein
MSTTDSPPSSLGSAIARGLWVIVVLGAGTFFARTGGWLPALAWRGSDWSAVLPRLVVLSALLALISFLLRSGARRQWAFVPTLPLAAALLRILARGRENPSAWLLDQALAVEALGWLVVVIAAVFWLYTRREHPPFARQRPIETVIEAEQGYLRERRALAGLPADSRPAALALSGGGVRSATTSLGLLQGLARLDLLRHVDYLSTVSGGGYVGAALTSLLSMRQPQAGEQTCGGDAQYRFRPGDTPRFGVTPESFPFRESGGASGEAGGDITAQVDHLRASGGYLVGRTGLFSREFLRTVGTLVFGVVSHVLHFGLLAVSLAAGYLWVVWLMVGDYAVERATPVFQTYAEYLQRLGSETRPIEKGLYLEYVRSALGMDQPTDLLHHPFTKAFVVGFVVTLLAVISSRWLKGLLHASLFEDAGRTREAIEGEASTLALVTILLLNAIVITWWHISSVGIGLLNISLPLVSYVGAGTSLFCRWAWVSSLSAPLGRKTRQRWRWAVAGGYDRDDRSRVSARAGSVIYLIGASLVLVLLVLPFLLFFQQVVDFFEARQVKSFFAWVATVAGARYLARDAAAAGAKATGGRFSSVWPTVKQALASFAFVIAVLGALLLICAVIWRRAEPEWRLPISLASLALYLLFGRVLDFNKLSLHYFYRDRLAEAYLMTLGSDGDGKLGCLRDNEKMRLCDVHGVSPGKLAATAAPYHLVMTCLNLSSAGDPRRRSRKSDQFLFSKLYCGSQTTGYVETDRRYPDETLARVMTISGAAASPAMGARTAFVQAASMTLFNLRLGQWVENPARWDPDSTGGGVFWPPYLFSEMLAATRSGSKRVYLSDGGHAGDNIGIYPLLERRCRLIVAIDVEEDPEYLFHSLNEALRQIQVDRRIDVDIRLDPLRPDPATSRASRHWALGLITYPATEGRPLEQGWLLLMKPSISGDEPEPVLNYQRENPSFPQQSTGDQFFDEAQFEAYRVMGQHVLASCPRDLLARLLREPASPELFTELAAAEPSVPPPPES